MKHFRHYLLGNKFKVRTDHNSLIWLMRLKNIEGQLPRWIEELQNYDMEVLYREGRDHGNADGMSRLSDMGSYDGDIRRELNTFRGSRRIWLLDVGYLNTSECPE